MTKHKIDLAEKLAPFVRQLHGGDTWVIQAGGRIKVQIKDAKGEPMRIILNESVPNKKKWKARITIVITEVDI